MCGPCSGTASPAQYPLHTEVPLQKPGTAPYLSPGAGVDRHPFRWAPLLPHGGGHRVRASGPGQHVEATMAALPLPHPRLQRAPGLEEPPLPDHPHLAGLGSPCGGPRPGPCLCPLWLLLLLLPQPHYHLLPCCPGSLRAVAGHRDTLEGSRRRGGCHLLAAPAQPPSLIQGRTQSSAPWSASDPPQAACPTCTALPLPLQRDCCLHGMRR